MLDRTSVDGDFCRVAPLRLNIWYSSVDPLPPLAGDHCGPYVGFCMISPKCFFGTKSIICVITLGLLIFNDTSDKE